MFDANRILGQLMGNPAAAGFAGGLAGGMLTSKSGRKMAKKTLTYGGLAAVGALAYHAWQQHRAARQPTQYQEHAGAAAPTPPPAQQAHGDEGLPVPPAGSAFLPAEDNVHATNELSLTLVRAMIAAANADGRLDAQEMQSILDRVGELDLSAEDKGRLMDELRRPVEIEELVKASTSPEMATEIYVAALLAIEVDTAGEKLWLRELAAKLELPQDVVEAVHRDVMEARG